MTDPGLSSTLDPRAARPQPTAADFEHLANTISQLAWMADPTGRIYWFNRRWYDYTGMRPADMKGFGWRQVHHPDHIDRVLTRYARSFEDGSAWEDTFPLRGADGSYRWFLSRAEPVRDGTGTILRWFGTNTDITGQIEAETRIRHSAQRFQTVLDASADVIWVASARGELQPPQPSWQAYTGQTEDDYVDGGGINAVHPDDREAVANLWQAALEDRSAFHAEFRIRRHDGEWRFSEVRAAPVLEPDGSVREWVGVNSDITERKAIEQALAAGRDAAEAANLAKSQFIANMSHELRTPLSAVIGYSEMLAEEIGDLGHMHLMADVGKIEASARHLLSLINDVLDLAKIEAGRMTLTSEWFDLGSVLDDVMATSGPLVKKRSNRMVLDVPDNIGRLRSDEVKLRQCLLNLIGNAAKFTENGTITLRIRREEGVASETAEAEFPGPDLVFEVEDTGIGMSADQVGRLFQRFSQADESTTREFGGSGLGLAITRALARQLGGDIEVESLSGKGSVFRLRIAQNLDADRGRGAGAVTEALQPLVTSSEGAGKRVLVVDDDPSARELLTRYLQREGFNVTCAADGRAGLSLASALRPEVVLLDVEMPRMDGWSVLHAMRSDPDLATTPVIMISVVNEEGLGYALGATDYLVKPVEWSRLKLLMERFLPRKDTGTVMVIDDDPDVRERLRFMLSREGWSVAEAGNGRQALDQLAERGTPGVILLDLMMPVVDGFDFLRKLRQKPEGGTVPVIVLTAKDVTAEEQRRLDKDADRVIAKGGLRLADLAVELRTMMAPDTKLRLPETF